MNRNRLPRWVNAVVDQIADSPMSPIGRIAARRLGTPLPSGSVAATSFDDRPLRVLIAPVNYSGQGHAWARSLEAADSSVSARNMAIDVPGGFSFDADLIVPVATYHNDHDWQLRQYEAATQATHVLVEAEEPPFGRLWGRSVQAQTAALVDSGVDVAFMAHGTDVRLPSRHLENNPWSHYADPEIYTPRDEALATRNITFLERSQRPVFVSTPDLLLDLPSASWCPVVVDPKRWAPAIPRGERPDGAPLRVVHAPSVSTIKGTHLMLPVLAALAEERVIELELVTGLASEHMPAIFARADVVIDQLRIGSYGVAACEAMAAGSVVVGHVSAAVRRLVEDATGLAVPLVEATPDTIEQVLRSLARRPLHAERSLSRAFVSEVHDGRRSSAILRSEWIDRAAHERTAHASTR